MRVGNFLRFVACHPAAGTDELYPQVFLVVLEEKVLAQHQEIIAEILLDYCTVIDAAAVVFDDVDANVEVAGWHFMLWSKESDLHSLLDSHFRRFTFADKQELSKHPRDNKSVFRVKLNEGEWIDDVIVRRGDSLPFVLLIVHVDVGLLTVVGATVMQQRDRPIFVMIRAVGKL